MFEYEGQSFQTEPQGGNTDLQITVVSGESDTVCEPWQQRDGVERLRDAGYQARLVSVPRGRSPDTRLPRASATGGGYRT